MNNLTRAIKIGIIILGILFILVSFFAEELHVDAQSGWGYGEIMLLSVGIILILFSFFEKRFINFYKTIAVILLNAVVLFIFTELFSAILLTVFPDEKETDAIPLEMNYYNKQYWGQEYWREHFDSGSKMYIPFVDWKRKPFKGNLINVDSMGIRNTPGSLCNKDSYKIFMFGGSALWGWGAPDSGTIPSFLLNELHGDFPNLCIKNFGEDSYVIFQNIIDLTNQLQMGNIPDLVIFYNGTNEILNSYANGKTNTHPYTETFSRKLAGPLNLSDFFSDTKIYRLINSYIIKKNLNNEYNMKDLAGNITDNYLWNLKTIKSLAKEYNFKCYFFWQPVIYLGNKHLTEWEERIVSKSEKNLIALYKDVYVLLKAKTKEIENVFLLNDAFDTITSSVYIDLVSHITPEGNKIISRIIVRYILEENKILVQPSDAHLSLQSN